LHYFLFHPTHYLPLNVCFFKGTIFSFFTAIFAATKPYHSNYLSFMPNRILALALFLSFFAATHACAQVNNRKYRVLFLGNSYTYVNNLPAVLTNAAASVGDTVVHDENTIGGYTLQQHSTNTTSVGKITAGGWDYVVLQEQSQLPSFPISDVETDVFPYARALDSLVHKYNSCGRSMFYMTWGRKNGDASNCPTWPPVCTYAGMDSLLQQRYRMMADSNDAVLSPAGAVWKYIRANYPTIDLYQSDESHPSEAGTYAAACCFYTAIFRKNPLAISYNFTLSATDAANIRTAVKNEVYDSMGKWHIGQYAPTAHGAYAIGTGNNVTFSNTSANATTYAWDFGDGATSTLSAPSHTYTSGGSYTVTLVAINCGKSDTAKIPLSLAVNAAAQPPLNNSFTISPNPVHDVLSLQLPAGLNSYDLYITNCSGQAVQTASSVPAASAIDVSQLSSGLYFATITAGGGLKLRAKFIKN
jgi:PKD repeat protein